MSENTSQAKYYLETTKYHVRRATTLGAGPVISALTIAATTAFVGVDLLNNDVDQHGTEYRDAVFAELEDNKATMMQDLREYQTILKQKNNSPDADAALSATLDKESDDLKHSSQVFFSTLLTNGSMQDGLDISEQDVKSLLMDISNESRDFNWGVHVDSSIETILENGVNYAGNLDEVRAEHRNDGTQSLSDSFGTAGNLAYDAKKMDESDGFLYFLGGLCTVFLTIFSGLGLSDSGRQRTQYMNKPQKPKRAAPH